MPRKREREGEGEGDVQQRRAALLARRATDRRRPALTRGYHRLRAQFKPCHSLGLRFAGARVTLDRQARIGFAILATLAAATINHDTNRHDEVLMGLLANHFRRRNGTIPEGVWLDVSSCILE